ncbi:MAG: cytochrome c [Candidatus Abyssobacteria bacterium SURF_17]|uniref:Cytochrome c n=1 Tax=Candidatus Abyssobacteria bacterium SURF_17 TaxID=2093361 RepID=A0A419EUE7_9BACT|nr:MAG: cytochrome c [Candidatus Abyssubacteria bacterium SURF_17]
MSKQFIIGLIAGVVICGVVGGLIGLSMVGKKATVEPPDWETYLITKLKNLEIPESPAPTIPIGTTDEDLLQGGEHYNHHCAVCHDLEGDADSAFAKGFYPPVSDLTSENVQRYSDQQLKWIVDNGIRYTGMPGWNGIIDDVTQWKIVHYMRALANPEKAGQLEAILKERGLWKALAPVDEHHEPEEAAEHEHPEGEHHH